MTHISFPLYRAWDISQKQMHPVKALSFDYCDVSGNKHDEVAVMYGEPYNGDALEALTGHHGSPYEDRMLWRTHEEPRDDGRPAMYATCILMECTHMPDLAGEMIYEGDVLMWEPNGSLSVVVKVQGGFETWDHPDIKKRGAHGSMVQNIDSITQAHRIIGNIYQHPNLLS